MAVSHGEVAVGTTATEIVAASGSWRRVYVSNEAGLGNEVHLGGEGITNATGFVLATGAEREFMLGPGDVLFGAAEVGTTNIGFMVVDV